MHRAPGPRAARAPTPPPPAPTSADATASDGATAATALELEWQRNLFAGFPGLRDDEAASSTVVERAPRDTGNVFDRLWGVDAGPDGNGATVAVRTGGEWSNPDADVLLDDQDQKASRRHSLNDHAPRPLFAWGPRGAAALWARPTYRTFIALLDNYAQRVGAAETVTDEEHAEQRAFLGAVAETRVFEAARAHIERVTGRAWPADALVSRVRALWFELRTLEFGGERTDDCSAFEHVFVGELADEGGSVAGYHSWIKFALDEAHGKVNFLGWRYDGKGRAKLGAARRNPDFAKVKFMMRRQSVNGVAIAAGAHAAVQAMPVVAEQDVADSGSGNADVSGSGSGGGSSAAVRKARVPLAPTESWKSGGVKQSGTFFVGCSPELLIMMATIAWFEATQSGQPEAYGWATGRGGGADTAGAHMHFKNKNVHIHGHKYVLELDATEDCIISFYQDHKGKVKLPPANTKKKKQRRPDA